VLPILIVEEDGPPTFDLGDGSVTELDSVIDLSVKLGEEELGASHVVCGPWCRVPTGHDHAPPVSLGQQTPSAP
jgi:hypothetical protein